MTLSRCWHTRCELLFTCCCCYHPRCGCGAHSPVGKWRARQCSGWGFRSFVRLCVGQCNPSILRRYEAGSFEYTRKALIDIHAELLQQLTALGGNVALEKLIKYVVVGRSCWLVGWCMGAYIIVAPCVTPRQIRHNTSRRLICIWIRVHACVLLLLSGVSRSYMHKKIVDDEEQRGDVPSPLVGLNLVLGGTDAV